MLAGIMRTALLVIASCTFACQPEPVWTADALASRTLRPATCERKSEVPGRCATRCGSYLTQFTLTAGDCGARADQIAELVGDPSEAPYPCEGNFRPSADRCNVEFYIRCPTKDDSGSSLASIERGTLRWVEKSTLAQGDVELWLTDADGDARCHSTYRVSVSLRQ